MKIISKKIKGWAVIQPDMQESMPFALLFHPRFHTFSEGIFRHEYAAKKMAEIYKELKVKVVPCTISYKFPSKKR